MKNKKTILFLLNRECSFLPPFMTLLDVLCERYSLKVISYERHDTIKALHELYKDKDVKFLYDKTQKTGNSLPLRIERRLQRTLKLKSQFHKDAVRLLSAEAYDLLWVVHEKTLLQFGDVLLGKRYVVSMYELMDHDRRFLDKIKEPLRNASEVVVAEYNRACILRVWEGLKRTPTVLPNKPYAHPRTPNIDNPYVSLLKDKKIILYQGYIQRSRNIDTLCEACRDFPEYSVVIMGGGDKSYIDDLRSKYSNVIHIPFVSPPNHLYITSNAYIGIVKYDFVSLNAIFCAPNKTWEYTGFGIPVLAHNIPGLQDSIGRYDAGICCDMDNVDEIKKALALIDANYDKYAANATRFYDSIDIRDSIFAISERNLAANQV